MTALRALQNHHRLFAALLIACALFARIAVPPGYMIGADARSGGATIEICTGQGPMQIAIPGSGHDGHDRSDHKATDHPCAFAGAAAAADVAIATPTPLPPVATHAPALSRPGFARPGLGLAAPPPPKTGPPAFA